MSTEPLAPSSQPAQKPGKSKTAEAQIRAMLLLTGVFITGLTIYTVFPEGSSIRELGTLTVCLLILLVLFRGPSGKK